MSKDSLSLRYVDIELLSALHILSERPGLRVAIVCGRHPNDQTVGDAVECHFGFE